jgi:YidC/Oxa1 family membrane protein insertase
MYAAIEGSQPGIWTPVYGLQTLIDYIHETFHVPWYAAIVGTAVFLRVLLFPLYLMSLRNSGRMRYVAPQISAWSAEAQLRIQRGEAPQTVYPLMRARMKELYREHDVSAIRTFLPAFAQFPVFITVFMSMRSMSRRFSGLESGGALWFPNLVIPDPNYVLPFISAGMMLLSFEVMKQPGVNKMLSFIITWGFRFVTVIFIPIACNLQAGLVLYFVTNNTLTVLQGLLTKFAATRRILSIPDPPPPESTDKARDEVLHSRVLPQVPFSTRIELDFKKQQAQKDSGKGPKIKDKGGKGEPPRYSSPRQAQAQAEASTDAPSQTSSAASGNTKSEDK